MSSERRINASRENGAKSHGPITEEGKQRSSANALRHGILSETVVFEQEDSEAFSELLAAYEAEFDPQTPNERSMIENLAIARWRLMRTWAMEKEELTIEMNKYDPETNSPVTRAALAFRALSDESRVLDNLHRYETRYDRAYHRALNQFLRRRQN